MKKSKEMLFASLINRKQFAILLVHAASTQTQVIHAPIPGETIVANIEN